MNILATISMIIFFPLNSFFLIQEGLSGEKQVEANVSEEQQNMASVKGVSVDKKENEILKPKAQAVDNPQFQPMRDEGIKDLVVPNAHASVIIDADTGTIMHYNEGRTKRQVASLTKMMTAILVMEKIKNLDEEIVTIDEEAVYVEGTKIGCPASGYCISQRLVIGEKITAGHLLEAMLMNSANDAAIALGKHISGSQEAFAGLMNKKAKELGLTDTNFCTPSGLESDGREAECYSSAYDIARITAYSMRYETIWEMFRLPNNSIITSIDGKIEHTILNTDLVLDKIPNVLGGKTGFTPLAGYSLLMAVSDQSTKHRIIAVVLDDSTRWIDIETMVSWAFDSYTWK